MLSNPVINCYNVHGVIPRPGVTVLQEGCSGTSFFFLFLIQGQYTEQCLDKQENQLKDIKLYQEHQVPASLSQAASGQAP